MNLKFIKESGLLFLCAILFFGSCEEQEPDDVKGVDFAIDVSPEILPQTFDIELSFYKNDPLKTDVEDMIFRKLTYSVEEADPNSHSVTLPIYGVPKDQYFVFAEILDLDGDNHFSGWYSHIETELTQTDTRTSIKMDQFVKDEMEVKSNSDLELKLYPKNPYSDQTVTFRAGLESADFTKNMKVTFDFYNDKYGVDASPMKSFNTDLSLSDTIAIHGSIDFIFNNIGAGDFYIYSLMKENNTKYDGWCGDSTVVSVTETGVYPIALKVK